MRIIYWLECRNLAAGDIINIETILVIKLTLWLSISDLRDSCINAIFLLKKHNCCPVIGEVFLE
jgi:hypothetical protein